MKTFFLKCLTVLEAWGFAADSPEGKWMRSFSSALAFSKLPFSCPSGRKWGVSYYEVEKSRRTRADSAEKHLRIFFFSQLLKYSKYCICFLFFGNKPAHREQNSQEFWSAATSLCPQGRNCFYIANLVEQKFMSSLIYALLLGRRDSNNWEPLDVETLILFLLYIV